MLLSLRAVGQSFTGIVTDSQHAAPLPYATIGVKSKSIGGIADMKGRFLIDLVKASPTDTIVVSYIGYQSTSFVKRDLTNSVYHIKLVPGAFQLHEVVTLGKREIISIGNKKASGQFTGWGDYSSSRGRLRGVAIETNEIPLRLAKFKMHLNACEFDSVRFRLHILPLQANHSGNLQAELINKNIFFTAQKDQKWVTVDLTPYNLIIHQNIIVAVEWVDSWVKKETIGESYLLTISLSREEGFTYLRKTPEEPFSVTKMKLTPTMYFETYKPGKTEMSSRP